MVSKEWSTKIINFTKLVGACVLGCGYICQIVKFHSFFLSKSVSFFLFWKVQGERKKGGGLKSYFNLLSMYNTSIAAVL